MENQRSNNRSPKGNFQPKNTNQKSSTTSANRPKKRHVSGKPEMQVETKTQRRRRVTVDRNVEVVVVSNTIGQFFYSNPRMSQVIDLQHIGDEEYITVGDLRTMINSNRKILEGFQLLITEVMDEQYTVEDVLVFLGLDKKYDEFFSLTNRTASNGTASAMDIKEFLTSTPVKQFEKIMESIDSKLREKIIESAVTLFKLQEFGDYNKMRIIESYVHEELFDDAETTEVDEEIYI
ncbi:hypothetical protein [Bacillus paranthracis]|uniref:hypothetical protein n=1 Tax=Bacillus paranthracis TaxID=2026186 RepID=UPI002D796B77|nr:hypothetical protein [Bacillus paranthracis]